MDLTQFNFSILKKFDRTLESNIERLVKNVASIEEDLSPIELKGMLCEALGLDILDSNSSQVVDQGENIQRVKLLAEGVMVIGDKINLKQYQWNNS